MTFRDVQVQEVLDVQWGDTKTTKSSYVDDGYLAYSATGPDGFLPKFDYDCDGVVLSAIGANCGSTFFATNKWSCIKNTIRILPRSSDIDLKYFYFMTKSPNFWPLRGSAQPFISQTDIREMVITIPDLATQKKIGDIFYGLELSIQKNGQIAETLEEIAREFYKSWFIDFEPVKAKMTGEKPVSMDDATAALFPDSMEDSELGPIPSGWNLKSLSEIGEFRNGLAMQKFPVVDDGSILPVIKIAQLRAGNSAGADLASGHIDPKFVISDGDILFSWSGTLEIEHWAGGPGALNQHLFKVIGKTVPDWFMFSSSRSHLPEFRKIASGKATTMGHIQRAHLDEAKVAVPPVALLEEVGGFLSALVAKKVALLVENRTLAEIRDALLPRLISGELQIPEETLVA
jgi:type I restriction enzyme S subunit